MSNDAYFEAVEAVYDARLAVEETFENEYIDVVGARHGYAPMFDDERGVLWVDVDPVNSTFEDGTPYGSVFTRPLVEFVEARGLEHFDHIVEVNDDTEYDTPVVVTLRFVTPLD